jgi:hypothetical protein
MLKEFAMKSETPRGRLKAFRVQSLLLQHDNIRKNTIACLVEKQLRQQHSFMHSSCLIVFLHLVAGSFTITFKPSIVPTSKLVQKDARTAGGDIARL